MRPRRQTALVLLAAVLGIVLAAGVTWGTSQLVRQRIGLASEPLTAGQRLLPSTTHGLRATGQRGKATTSTPLPVPAPGSGPSPSTGDGTDRADSVSGSGRDD